MTPAELEAYRRRFEAARSFEDDDEWFKEPTYTTNTPLATATANKPVLKPTAQKWSFQGIQPPTGPKVKKLPVEGAVPKRPGAVQHPVQYPRSGLGGNMMSGAAGEHDRVDSRASSSEMDEQSQDGSVDMKPR